jgi:small-conductance mechanosensitive channel
MENNFSSTWHLVANFTPRIVAAVAVLGLCLWGGRTLGRMTVRVLAEKNATKVYVRFVQQLATWLLGLLGLILALNILGLGSVAMSLMAGGGMAAIVFGFAFREIGENFIAGFFLTFSRSFEVGDVIESESLIGEVKNIELRHVHIRTPDGCDIFIPSTQIFKSPLHNYTRDGLRRPGFVVGIDYADDPKQARALLLEVVKSVAGVLKEPQPNVLMSALLPQYVELQVNFWVDTFDKNHSLAEVKNAVMDCCCQALKDAGFTFSANASSNLNLTTPAPLALALEALPQAPQATTPTNG